MWSSYYCPHVFQFENRRGAVKGILGTISVAGLGLRLGWWASISAAPKGISLSLTLKPGLPKSVSLHSDEKLEAEGRMQPILLLKRNRAGGVP